MIKIFYHIYCIPGVTDGIVHDQLTKLVFSGLYHTADHIYVCLTSGREDSAAIEEVEARIHTFNGHRNKIQIIARQAGDCTYERFTFRTMLAQGLVSPDDKILYMHSKGVTRTIETERNVTASVVYYWRTFMEYELFARHRECIARLDSSSTVGVNYREFPTPHYSGNFWWARGDYFLSLDPALLDAVFPGCDCNHISPELWIGSGSGHNKQMGILSEYHLPCYQRICPMGEYIDDHI